MEHTIKIPKTAVSENDELFSHLSRVCLSVEDRADAFICTAGSIELLNLIGFLREKGIQFKLNPQSVSK